MQHETYAEVRICQAWTSSSVKLGTQYSTPFLTYVGDFLIHNIFIFKIPYFPRLLSLAVMISPLQLQLVYGDGPEFDPQSDQRDF